MNDEGDRYVQHSILMDLFTTSNLMASRIVHSGQTHECFSRFLRKPSTKSFHGGVLLLVKLQTFACNFTKSNTLPWVFFATFKLYKMLPNRAKHHTYLSKDIRTTPMDGSFFIFGFQQIFIL